MVKCEYMNSHYIPLETRKLQIQMDRDTNGTIYRVSDQVIVDISNELLTKYNTHPISLLRQRSKDKKLLKNYRDLLIYIKLNKR